MENIGEPRVLRNSRQGRFDPPWGGMISITGGNLYETFLCIAALCRDALRFGRSGLGGGGHLQGCRRLAGRLHRGR